MIEMFVTDDHNAKQSLLRSIQQNNFEGVAMKDDSYWLKANGAHGSPGPKLVHDFHSLSDSQKQRIFFTVVKRKKLFQGSV